MAKSKVSMLKLLSLCRKYGTDEDAARRISEELGISIRAVFSKIDEYCIIPNLYSGLGEE